MNTEQSKARSLHRFKSRYSGGAGGGCVEVAARSASVRVRDSKDTGRGAFTVPAAAWSAFVAHARHARRPGTGTVRTAASVPRAAPSGAARVFPAGGKAGYG